MVKIIFSKTPCVVSFGKYGNGRTAIELYIEASGEPMLTASINIPNEPITNNEIIIKNYGENEGIIDDLIAAGIVSKPKRYTRSGYITAPICDLLVESK